MNKAVNQEEAVAFMLEKFEIIVSMYHGFDLPAEASAQTGYTSLLPTDPAKHIAGIAAAPEAEGMAPS